MIRPLYSINRLFMGRLSLYCTFELKYTISPRQPKLTFLGYNFKNMYNISKMELCKKKLRTGNSLLIITKLISMGF